MAGDDKRAFATRMHDHSQAYESPVAGGGASAHADLTGVGTDDHHTRYTDAEAVTATAASYEAAGAIATHAADVDAHHAKYTDAEVDVRIGLAAIDDLSDVVITTPSNGEQIVYSGGNWVNSAYVPPSTTLSDSTDCDTDNDHSPLDGDVLTWDSGAAVWRAEAASGGVTDHGALTGLTDDDHARYADMYSQAGAPSNPSGDRPTFWLDTDATPTVDTHDHDSDYEELLAEGTSFPGSPSTLDKYWRTDIMGGMEFFYDGTRWVSTQIFHTSPHNRGLSTGISATTYIDTQTFDADYDCWVINAHLGWYVTSVNNSSNYWSLRAWNMASGAQTTLYDTHSDGAVASWRLNNVAMNLVAASAANTLPGYHFYVVKSGSPGTLDFDAYFSYRLIAT